MCVYPQRKPRAELFGGAERIYEIIIHPITINGATYYYATIGDDVHEVGTVILEVHLDNADDFEDTDEES